MTGLSQRSRFEIFQSWVDGLRNEANVFSETEDAKDKDNECQLVINTRILEMTIEIPILVIIT